MAPVFSGSSRPLRAAIPTGVGDTGTAFSNLSPRCGVSGIRQEAAEQRRPEQPSAAGERQHLEAAGRDSSERRASERALPDECCVTARRDEPPGPRKGPQKPFGARVSRGTSRTVNAESEARRARHESPSVHLGIGTRGPGDTGRSFNTPPPERPHIQPWSRRYGA